MKFGKYLAENLVPEWRSQYVAYRALKKQIKRTKTALKGEKRLSPRIFSRASVAPEAAMAGRHVAAPLTFRQAALMVKTAVRFSALVRDFASRNRTVPVAASQRSEYAPPPSIGDVPFRHALLTPVAVHQRSLPSSDVQVLDVDDFGERIPPPLLAFDHLSVPSREGHAPTLASVEKRSEGNAITPDSSEFHPGHDEVGGGGRLNGQNEWNT
jgi:hypothetical protein